MSRNTNITHVGAVELIDLPEQRLAGVPAKVDTGADSSAIWVSSVVERDNRLEFVLFGQGSPFYSGEALTTEKYKVLSVRNSFGEAEHRYKIFLKLKLNGKIIKAGFTLADRSRNRYPVLIGRKTLHGHFVVDVTKRPEAKVKNILMLSTKHTKPSAKYAQNLSAASDKFQIAYASYEDLDFIIDEPRNSILLQPEGRDIASFDMVYFKTSSHFMATAAATARYLEKRGVPFFDAVIKHFPGGDKLYQYVLLEGGPLRVPGSVFMSPRRLVGAFQLLKNQLGLPFVLKDVQGNKGDNNYLIGDEEEFTRAREKIDRAGLRCIAQTFIPNNCDFRLLVFGNRIALVIKRTRDASRTHLNNTSKGATAELVPTASLPTEVQTACIDACDLMERQVAGVDVVQDKITGEWYCLEVNDGPQLATGSFKREKYQEVAKFLEKELGQAF